MASMSALHGALTPTGTPGRANACWWLSGADRGAWWRVTMPCRMVHHLPRVDGPLESVWLGGALLICTVLSVAGWAAWSWRRRRAGRRAPAWRRWTGRVLGATGVLTLVCATGLAFINSYAGYAPTVSSLPTLLTGQPTAGLAGGGASRVVVVEVGAPRLRIPPRPAYVYLPAGYTDRSEAHRRYPVVYLIHGYPGGPADWINAAGLRDTMNALIADRQIPPMIAVTPDANGGWLHDSECLNQVGGPQVATYLTQTLVDYIDRHFRTIADRDGRVLGGASSGGYCALNLGLHHLDTYAVLLAFEPYGDPGAENRTALLGGSWAAYRANSPATYLPTMVFGHPVAVFIDAGGAAPADVARARRLAEELARRGQTVAFRVEPGQTHTWREAAVGLPYALTFAAQRLRTDGPAVLATAGHPNPPSPRAVRS